MDVNINIECLCVPRNPFYVRWINELGGMDYWMFANAQIYDTEQSELKSFDPYILNMRTATGTKNVYSKTITEKVTVGADFLTQNEFDTIVKIANSSYVGLYFGFDPASGPTWLDLIVSKLKASKNTDNKLQSIEIIFELPTQQLAI